LLTLRSPAFQARAAQWITGATIKGLNIGDLERLRVPWSTCERQMRDLSTLEPFIASSGRLVEALQRQVELLSEHRQALITAAITGELDLGVVA
jgi:type I restriction enzyme S subunit